MKRNLIFILFVILLSACDTHTDVAPLTFNFCMSLPMGNSSSPVSCIAADNRNRVMGDPGTYESFRKPRYAYIYFINKNATTTSVTVLQRDQIQESDWVATAYNGQYQLSGDSVYNYKKTFVLILSAKRTEGRVYAAMSYYPLSGLHVKGKDASYEPQTEEDVMNLVFNLDTDLKSSLQDIYSSPLAYQYNGEYYGTIQNYAYDPSTGEGEKVVSLNIPLYHVASKVDVMWNVQEAMQEQTRVTNMKATHLYDTDCYLFRPTDNSIDAATYSSGYQVELTSDNIGTQWEGRSYFYAIPYTNNAGKCPLQLEVQANGNTTGSYKTTVLNDPSSPFVPWLRGRINITSNVETLYN